MVPKMLESLGTDSYLDGKINPKNIRISDFGYDLPDYRIAKFPLQDRDLSKLLVLQSGEIQSDLFQNLQKYIPSSSCLVFNNSKVIQARLVFQSPTGAEIEVFCLEPYLAEKGFREGIAEWKCFIGNAKRWKVDSLVKISDFESRRIELKVSKVSSQEDYFVVRFEWEPLEMTFDEVLGVMGFLPLPPYLNRSANEDDKKRYQTIYAQFSGSVAAPTAGLHFTDRVILGLRQKDIAMEYLTLHVGAGTFKPVKSETMEGHSMHDERVVIKRETILRLIGFLGNITAVGTTSTRTLESLYWLGVMVSQQPDLVHDRLMVGQWVPYDTHTNGQLSTKDSLASLVNYLDANGLDELSFRTQILIVPGYQFQLVDRLITNFHQPESTLILLVAAFVGEQWREVYQYAMDNDYRFLSYGDSSLLFRK